MQLFLKGLLLFNSLSFLFFGLSCFFSPFIKIEFERYNLASYRISTGFFQLVGAFGLLIGLYYNYLALLSALCLAVLLFSGFIMRIAIKDSLLLSLPSLLFALLNLFTFVLLFIFV